MTTTVKVTRKDSPLWKQLASGKVGPGRVKVGIPEGSGAYPDGTTVAEVAAYNHDGTDTIPARPFLSVPLDGRRSPVRAIMARVSKAVLAGKLTTDQGLRLLGQWGRDEVIRAINAGFPPENAERTIARKGSSTPLVDTGQLKGSITYVVE